MRQRSGDHYRLILAGPYGADLFLELADRHVGVGHERANVFEY